MARAIVLSLLTLLFASSVAVGVDLADRAQESHVFTVPPLTAGARAVYGVTVLSDLHDDATAPKSLVLKVSEAFADDDPSGNGDEWFLFTTERSPMPWDTEETVFAAGAGKQKAARHSASTEEAVRLDDGRVLLRETTIHDERWRARDGTAQLDEALRHRMDHMPSQEGPWSALQTHLSTRYAYRDPWLEPTQAADPAEVRVTRALLDGETVYGSSRQHTHDAQRGQGFGCHLAVPQYTYAETTSTGVYAQRSVHSTATETVWVSPDHTFPVLSVCETTYRLDGSDGDLIGTLRVLARLQDETRGEDPLRAGEGAGLLAPRPVLRPLERHASGLPADPDPMFRFDLDQAYTTLVESDHEELAAFRGTTSPPFYVLSATYHPDALESTACAALDPLCPIEQEGRRATETARPAWTFRLQNDHGEQMEVRVERQVTANGEGAPPEISATAPLNQERFPMRLDEIPPKLTAPSDVLAIWLKHEQVDFERWRGDTKAHFTIQYTRHEGHIVPHYLIEGDLSDHEPVESILDKGLDPETWSGTFYHRYRGTDGILLDHGTAATGLEARPPPPPPHDPVVRYDSGLRAADHASTLALIAGGISLVGLATALRTGVPDWARRLLLLPLFTKLRKDQVLDHKTRDEMIAYVAAHPGIGTEDIRRHFGIGWGTAVYHLSALEQNHLLSSIRSGGHRHWFPAKALDARTKEMLALLRGPAARRLYELVTRFPGRTQQEIAHELGVTHGAVIFQVRKLERVGLIRKERDGRYVRYHAEPVPGSARRDPAPEPIK